MQDTRLRAMVNTYNAFRHVETLFVQGRNLKPCTIDKRHTRYVLTLFTFQSGTLMCTAHSNGPYIEGHPRLSNMFIIFDG